MDGSTVGVAVGKGVAVGVLVGAGVIVGVAVGIGVGTWTGFQMSRLAVSPLAITEAGNPVTPPFILVTNWFVMAPTFVALVTVFGAAVYLLHRGIGELDLRVVSRFGE